MSEEAEKCFEVIREDMNLRFAEAQANFEKRFEKGHEEAKKRFEVIREDMNFRFEQINKRFTTMQWSINLGFAVIAGLISILKFIQ